LGSDAATQKAFLNYRSRACDATNYADELEDWFIAWEEFL